MFGFNRSAPAADTLPVRVPTGIRAYAIGDIHGRADLLDDLLARIEADAASATGEKHLIFLGDYIDRGRTSRQVIERLLAPFPGYQITFLMGNHEAALLHFLAHPDFWPSFAPYGAVETLLSYGVRIDPKLKAKAQAEEVHAQTKALLPASHVDFLTRLTLSHTLGDYHFVHAGVHPEKPLDAQDGADLMRIREPFLSHAQRLEKMVVHGHTITEEVEFHPHRIGIDTGAYATGRLTALVLEDETRRLLQTG